MEEIQQTNYLFFERTQEIQQLPGETSEALHERIRYIAINSFVTIETPTEINTPSWYTFDISGITGIPNSCLVSTSTCKHELPARIFVGTRETNWMTPAENGRTKYRLEPLGRELTLEEKNTIYDRML